MKNQYDVGADPYVVLSDLADFVHYVTRLKYATSDGPGSMMGEGSALSEDERKRGKEFADKLSIRVLGRTWQILLKGLTEVRSSERALAAADMVLVRLTHAADLPSHEELVKQVRDGSATSQTSPTPTNGGSVSAVSQSAQNSPMASSEAPTASAPLQFPDAKSSEQISTSSQAPQTGQLEQANAQRQPKPNAQIEQGDQPPLILNTFDELIFLCEDKRDLKTKTYLRRHVRLIDFKSGYFEFRQVGNASREALQSVKNQLERWTRMRWNFVISDKEGLPTFEELEAAEKDNQMEKARSHPAVAAIMKAFDGARIVDVRIKEKTLDALPAAPEEYETPDEGLDDFFE